MNLLLNILLNTLLNVLLIILLRIQAVVSIDNVRCCFYDWRRNAFDKKGGKKGKRGSFNPSFSYINPSLLSPKPWAKTSPFPLFSPFSPLYISLYLYSLLLYILLTIYLLSILFNILLYYWLYYFTEAMLSFTEAVLYFTELACCLSMNRCYHSMDQGCLSINQCVVFQWMSGVSQWMSGVSQWIIASVGVNCWRGATWSVLGFRQIAVLTWHRRGLAPQRACLSTYPHCSNSIRSLSVRSKLHCCSLLWTTVNYPTVNYCELLINYCELYCTLLWTTVFIYGHLTVFEWRVTQRVIVTAICRCV